MGKKKVASSACNSNNHTSTFPRGKLHTSACSRNVFLTTSCLVIENSRKPLTQGPNFNKIIFTISSRTFFKLYFFYYFLWWVCNGKKCKDYGYRLVPLPQSVLKQLWFYPPLSLYLWCKVNVMKKANDMLYYGKFDFEDSLKVSGPPRGPHIWDSLD